MLNVGSLLGQKKMNSNATVWAFGFEAEKVDDWRFAVVYLLLKKFFKRLVFIQPGETPLSTVRIFWVIPLYWLNSESLELWTIHIFSRRLVLKLCTMLVSYRGKPFDLNWVLVIFRYCR